MNNQQWSTLAPFEIKKFDEVDAILHRAAQFLAMVGKNYVSHREDDSHANVAWDAERSAMVTWPIEGSAIKVAFQVPTFQLQLIKEGSVVNLLALHGSTKSAAFDWLKNAMEQAGLAPEKLQYISHYDVPEHPVDKGAPFEKPEDAILENWMVARSNANLSLLELTQSFGTPSAVRIWPHHFDTGIYHDLTGKGIGMGWAISDSLFHEPYFYNYVWSPEKEVKYAVLPKPTYGNWHDEPDGWKGAYLTASELFGETDGNVQSDMVRRFFQETTDWLLEAIGGGRAGKD